MGLGHWEKEAERGEMRERSLMYILGWMHGVYDKERWLPLTSVRCCSTAENLSSDKAQYIDHSLVTIHSDYCLYEAASA